MKIPRGVHLKVDFIRLLLHKLHQEEYNQRICLN